ncbi:hypothetical protein [Rothia halotolerans]|uniref:hypothetical protein n=1 Tax=Rothia halotolerans TaxID=405770 RepID=UPI00101CC527|nr:hypothetical protein [Rothia halotolerans]
MSSRTRTDWPTTILGLAALFAVFLFWNAGSGLLSGTVSVVGLFLCLFGAACILVVSALRRRGRREAELREPRSRR